MSFDFKRWTIELILRFRQTKKLRYKQMVVFHKSFQYTPSNLSDFIVRSFLLQFMQHVLQR